MLWGFSLSCIVLNRIRWSAKYPAFPPEFLPHTPEGGTTTHEIRTKTTDTSESKILYMTPYKPSAQYAHHVQAGGHQRTSLREQGWRG